MELLKKTQCILFLFIIVSCSTSSKFNREVNRVDKKNNLFTYKENKCFFGSLKKELVNSDCIYYITSTINNQNDFFGVTGIIFDENNNVIYNLEYDKNNRVVLKKSLPIDLKTRSLDHSYNQFVYSVFKNSSCDSLIKLSDKTKHVSGIGSEDRVYKIDLKNSKNNKVCHFQRIFYFQDLYEQQLNNN